MNIHLQLIFVNRFCTKLCLDIIFKGRNVRTFATDELTLVSDDKMKIDCSILHLTGTNTNILGTQRLSMAANFVETEGGASVESGTNTDAIKGGFLGMIMKGITRFKKFLA